MAAAAAVAAGMTVFDIYREIELDLIEDLHKLLGYDGILKARREENTVEFRNYLLQNKGDEINFANLKPEYQRFLEKYETVEGNRISTLFLGMGPSWNQENAIPFDYRKSADGKTENGHSNLHNWLELTGRSTNEKLKKPFWSLMQLLCRTSANFYQRCVVRNYCPFGFGKDGKDVSLQKLPYKIRNDIKEVCKKRLTGFIELLMVGRTTPLQIVILGQYDTEGIEEVVDIIKEENVGGQWIEDPLKIVHPAAWGMTADSWKKQAMLQLLDCYGGSLSSFANKKPINFSKTFVGFEREKVEHEVKKERDGYWREDLFNHYQETGIFRDRTEDQLGNMWLDKKAKQKQTPTIVTCPHCGLVKNDARGFHNHIKFCSKKVPSKLLTNTREEEGGRYQEYATQKQTPIKVTCPHCGLMKDDARGFHNHIKFCKKNPNRPLTKSEEEEGRRYHDYAKHRQTPTKVTCPHCGLTKDDARGFHNHIEFCYKKVPSKLLTNTREEEGGRYHEYATQRQTPTTVTCPHCGLTKDDARGFHNHIKFCMKSPNKPMAKIKHEEGGRYDQKTKQKQKPTKVTCPHCGLTKDDARGFHNHIKFCKKNPDRPLTKSR